MITVSLLGLFTPLQIELMNFDKERAIERAIEIINGASFVWLLIRN